MSSWQWVMFVILAIKVFASLIYAFGKERNPAKATEGLIDGLILFLVTYGGGFWK